MLSCACILDAGILVCSFFLYGFRSRMWSNLPWELFLSLNSRIVPRWRSITLLRYNTVYPNFNLAIFSSSLWELRSRRPKDPSVYIKGPAWNRMTVEDDLPSFCHMYLDSYTYLNWQDWLSIESILEYLHHPSHHSQLTLYCKESGEILRKWYPMHV